MSRISVGRLKVLAPAQIYEFGQGGGASAELKIVSDTFWVRVLLLGDLVWTGTWLYANGILGVR